MISRRKKLLHLQLGKVNRRESDHQYSDDPNDPDYEEEEDEEEVDYEEEEVDEIETSELKSSLTPKRSTHFIKIELFFYLY